ncbi:MAG: DUF89 family protein [Clostridiales bacterium]|nr:DUF89 family protein [Clostridiales bacterium]
MKLQAECVTCIIAQVKNVTAMLNLSDLEREAAMQDTLNYLSGANYEGCTPESMGDLWQILLGHIGQNDPYADIKSLCNREAMKMLPATREKVARAEDPFSVALKYAIAGNLIDYGLEHPVSLDEQNAQIDAIANTPFSRDDSAELREALGRAKRMLYLGDNAGEIVFDRLFIERIRAEFPQMEISVVVKGSAVLNDVTCADALEVGMDELARVIDNGDGSPGTVLPRTSAAFRQAFAEADVVLSKGQGNFESLSETTKDQLYFLFTAKCDSVCAEAGVPKFSIVCMKNGAL